MARITTILGIAGFYISLLIAGYFYWSQNELASVTANQVLLTGVMTSFTLLGIGCLLVLIILAENHKRQPQSAVCAAGSMGTK